MEASASTMKLDPKPAELPSTVKQHADILKKALEIYEERNAKYHDGWRRSGWRGTLCDLRRKIERSWSHLWDAQPHSTKSNPTDTLVGPDVDDLYDIINYAAFTIRAIREGNRDGTGGWW